MHRVERAGHGLSRNSICGADGIIPKIAELTQRLKDDPSDGYLVSVLSADIFLQALGKVHTPVVFFSESSCGIRHEPVVMLDSLEAVGRGVHLLAGQGYQRIGFIGLDYFDRPGESSDSLRKAYERAVIDAGLDYQASEFTKADVQESIAACRRFLARPESPQAIIVANDTVLNGLAEVLIADGIVPGRDLGVITLSNVCSRLPKGIEWSRLEFNVEGLGEVVVNTLLGLLQTAGLRANSSAIFARWKPGRTHLMKGK